MFILNQNRVYGQSGSTPLMGNGILKATMIAKKKPQNESIG